jgi:hypothetical protein
MSDDNVMYDTPLEFMAEVAESDRACVAQSIIPDYENESGGYHCACSCENWEIMAPSRDQGIRLAREHVARVKAAASV